MKELNWAIWGTGGISNSFASAFPYVENGRLYAALSRTQQNAEEFAKKYGCEKAYSEPEELLADPAVDVVYIGTPNFAHLEDVLACLRAGKHTVCEKPMAVNAGEFDAMAAEARKAGVFLMEGTWTQFFPATRKIKEWIAAGKIGRPLQGNASFCFHSDPGGWRQVDGLAAGALLDLGIYCLTFLSYAFGLEPEVIQSDCVIENGTDVTESVILKFAPDQIASFSCGFKTVGIQKAVIQGEDGCIIAGPQFWKPAKAELFGYAGIRSSEGDLLETFVDEYPASGFQYEAAHVGECILSGKTESDILPLSESCKMIRLMDRIRREWPL